MRNLLMLLVVANVLYFMWDRFIEQPIEAGVAVVDENRLGPPLKIFKASEYASTVDTAIAEAAASVGAVLSSGKPKELAAVVGQSCVSISFRDRSEAGSAMADYRDAGMHVSQRSAMGEVFIGNWVQIRKIATRQAGDEMMETLREGGISDVILLQDKGLYKISLGLFGEEAGVEKMELQARSLGLEPEILPELREAELHYVDIALLPGRGAGDMVERYGEQRVLLRDRATCPTSN